MNFKTTDALFAKIKEDLYSFDAAGLLDEGKFHKDVQYVLASLGVMWYRDAEEMINIENYKGCLPDDFSELNAIYRCRSCGSPTILPDGVVFTELTFDTLAPDLDPHSYTCPATPPTVPLNSHSRLLIQRGNTVHRYDPPVLMRPGNVNTKRMCAQSCPNHYSESTDTFTIQNRKIHVNFNEGDVLMVYKAFPLDEETGLPMIPDNIIIEKAIEDYIKYNVIKVLRTNGDADVAQLIPLYRNDMDLSMGKAITETKTPSFSTMVNNIRLVRKGLNVYQFPQHRH